MTFFERLQNLDRRVIYIVLLIAISFPLLKPLNLPIIVSKETKGIYDTIEALPAGSVVALSFDYATTGYSEMHPQASVVFQHLLMRPDLKVILVAFWEAGPMFAQQLIDGQVDLMGKQYGIDFVNLGYIPGGETAMSAFASNIHGAYPRDYLGTSIASMPMMADIKTAKDISLFITIAAGSPGVPEIVRQIQGPYGVKFASGVTAISAPISMPYISSKQMIGMMSGIGGAAEYEVLLEMPGAAVSAMDAMSASHLVMIAFLIIGNIGYFVTKYNQQKGGKA